MAAHADVHMGMPAAPALCELLIVCHCGPLLWRSVQYRDWNGYTNKKRNKRDYLIHW